MSILNCEKGSGAIIYPVETNSGPGGPSLSGGAGYGYSGAGGLGGGGSIWSSVEQIIWISINNAPKYPVYLKPGFNDVHFWIPFIFPDDEWVEAPLVIEADGYILIPAGFEFDINIDDKAPEKLGNQKMADKIKIIDIYDIEIHDIPIPVDLDNLIDEFTIGDLHSLDIIAISNIFDNKYIENLSFNDYCNTDIIVYFNGESDNFDNISISDLYNLEKKEINVSEYNTLDDIYFKDEIDNDKSKVEISNNAEYENIGFNDFVDIDKE